MNYPKELLQAIAKDILKVPTSKYNSFSKQANIQESRAEFLKNYQLKPESFTQDPIAGKDIRERQKAIEQQIRGFYQQQAKATGMTDEMKTSQKDMLMNLQTQTDTAVRNASIDRTRLVAEADPDNFNKHLTLSRQSQEELGNSHGKEIGAVGGGLAGLAGGYALGSMVPRKTKGILQKGLGSVAGWAAGTNIGRRFGEDYDEKKTGFNHEDLLTPYQIADRMQQRSR